MSPRGVELQKTAPRAFESPDLPDSRQGSGKVGRAVLGPFPDHVPHRPRDHLATASQALQSHTSSLRRPFSQEHMNIAGRASSSEVQIPTSRSSARILVSAGDIPIERVAIDSHAVLLPEGLEDRFYPIQPAARRARLYYFMLNWRECGLAYGKSPQRPWSNEPSGTNSLSTL